MSSTTDKERQLIFEPWLRILVRSDICVQNIAKLVSKFSKICEGFDRSLSNEIMKIEGQVIHPLPYRMASAFGKMIANPSHRYHWKLQPTKRRAEGINIGIIEASKCEKK